MTLLEEFEDLCKYIREVTGSDLVCGLCEYDAGTVGEEPIECPGFESNECFVLKESLRKQYEMYAQVIRCKDCVFWKEYCRVVDGVRTDHVCSKKRELDGLMHRTKADDFCSWAERKEECGQRSAD